MLEFTPIKIYDVPMCLVILNDHRHQRWRPSRCERPLPKKKGTKNQREMFELFKGPVCGNQYGSAFEILLKNYLRNTPLPSKIEEGGGGYPPQAQKEIPETGKT